MPISSAIQKGSSVHVYDERGRTMFIKSVGSKPSDGLKGYTSTTVTIQQSLSIHTYDEKGRTKFIKSA